MEAKLEVSLLLIILLLYYTVSYTAQIIVMFSDVPTRWSAGWSSTNLFSMMSVII